MKWKRKHTQESSYKIRNCYSEKIKQQQQKCKAPETQNERKRKKDKITSTRREKQQMLKHWYRQFMV